MKLSNKQKGILALIGLAFTYASFGFFTRYLSVSFGFFQQLYLRIFAGLIIGFLMFGKSFDFSKLKKITPGEWLLLIFRAAAYYLLGAALFNKAVLLTKISTVAFIGAIPMTAVLGFLILKEKVSLKKIIYISLSFAGVIAISINNFSSFAFGQGEIFAIISNFFAALSIIFRKYQTKLLNNVEITQIQLFIAFIFILIASLLAREGLPINNWNGSVLLIILLSGLANVLMIFFTNYGFEHVKTSIASNILTLEMFFAVLIGLIIYREVPSLKEILGGALILFSVIQMNKLE
ncbi:MAG: DMT family transporter [Patescibacteria group bacterium]|jgi:drug/metabolite transporter (DMT)-like permease